jgi:hypothetical protein
MQDFPEDFKPEAVKVGNRWIGFFTLPWARQKPVRDPRTKEVCRYETELEAFTAATAVMCHHFRNKTRGWGDRIDPGSVGEIEKVFGAGATKKKRRMGKAGRQ